MKIKKSKLKNNTYIISKILLPYTELDKPVIYGFLYRGGQALFGLMNLYLISVFFSPEIQGFYYTFSSILALQSFFELGLYIVIITFASHQWVHLQIDLNGNVIGDIVSLRGLRFLLKNTAKWYFFCSVIFLFVVGMIGFLFLNAVTSHSVSWKIPWFLSVFLAAVQLWLMPLICLLEGCNQVYVVNRFKFFQVILESCVAWFLFLNNAGLWVMVGILVGRVLTSVYFLFGTNRRFFLSIWEVPVDNDPSLCLEIWPMQWRLAVQSVFNYLAYNAFVPIVFYFQGAIVAGQLGMSLQLMTTITTITIIWVQAKIPIFGNFVALREFSKLDYVWFKFSCLALFSTTLMGLTLLVAVYLLEIWEHELSNRVLDLEIMLIFLGSFCFLQISTCQSMYLRAFAKEPLMYLGILSGIFFAIAVYIFTEKFGVNGTAYAHFLVTLMFVLPGSTLIWYFKRKAWTN